MTTTHQTHLQQLENCEAPAFVHSCLEVVYPDLFQLLDDIGIQLQELSIYGDVTVLQVLLARIVQQTDEMYRKEKLVLFPYLLQLESAHGVSYSQKPFENIAQHYNCIRAILAEGYNEFEDTYNNSANHTLVNEMIINWKEFEEMLSNVYQKKVNYLFARYKHIS